MLVENYNYLFNDGCRRVLEQVRSGVVGEPVNLDISMGVGLSGAAYSDPDIPHFAHRLPGGAMRNFASHPASIAVALLGDLESVQVRQRQLVAGLTGNDELRALAENDRGSAAISITSNSRPYDFSLLLRCTEATLGCDVLSDLVSVSRDGSPLAQVGDEFRQGLGWISSAGNKVRRATTTRQGYFRGFERLLTGFYEAIANGTEPPISIAEMDSTNRLVEALFAPENQL
jgi:predicted dehydrogenase